MPPFFCRWKWGRHSPTSSTSPRAPSRRWREVTDFALPADLRPPPWPDAGPGSRVSGALQAWAWQSAYENRASDASSSPC